MTADGLWVVWAYKLARQRGNLFVALRGDASYPADARAECRSHGARGARSAHRVPDPGCTCGFHALSDQRLPGLPARGGLPAACPVLPVCHDDAGWCTQPGTPRRAPASLALV